MVKHFCSRFCPGRFGFAFGLIWALGILLMGWAAWLWNYGVDFVNVMGSVYLGFKPTFVGAIIGAIWGFIDLFIFAWLVALVYNCMCGRKSEGATSGEKSSGGPAEI